MYGYFKCDCFMMRTLDGIAPYMVYALSPLGRDNLSCALYAECLHPTLYLSLSTGAALGSPTRSFSQDPSHMSHLAEGECTHVQKALRWMPTHLGSACTRLIPHVVCASSNLLNSAHACLPLTVHRGCSWISNKSLLWKHFRASARLLSTCERLSFIANQLILRRDLRWIEMSPQDESMSGQTED